MKKLTILTSILALAACGGSGGGSGAARTSVHSIDLGGQYSKIACNQARTECRGVTVDADGNNVVSDARVASKKLSRSATPTHGKISVGEEKWDLFYADDIDMNIIYSPGKLAKQTFIVDSKGNITGLKWSGDDEVKKFVPGVVLSGMKYMGDNKFSLKSSKDDGTLEFENYEGLQFANFGVVKIRDMKWWNAEENKWHDIGEGNMDIPFAGGHKVLEQDPATNLYDQIDTQPIVYTGTARGMVEYAGTETSSDAAQDYLNIIANNATLTLSTNGTGGVKETFYGEFKRTEDSTDWYKITATKDNDTVNYGFSGENKTGSDRFDIAGTNRTIQTFDAGYYSDKKDIAAEASGLLQYQEIIDPTLTEEGSNNPMIQGNNKTIYIGFGGKTE